MEFGIVERPCLGETVSGDACFVRECDGQTLIAVIDGLGHGPGAALVAQKAIGYLEEHHREGLTEIIQGCHGALKGTRGAAMGLALIDHQLATLTYVGIGNVEIRVVGEKSHSLVSMPGIVGYDMRKIRPEEMAYHPGDLVIMHSDGVSAKFSLAQYPGLRQKDPQQIAEAIFRDHARGHDDATIMVVR
jgi:negative regulator of sigma-B (phosphoserine phosphatase)